MKRMILFISSILAIYLGTYIFLCVPITKLSTSNALVAIEENYLRKDLAAPEKEKYQFFKGWILSNARTEQGNNERVRTAGLWLSALLLLNNIILFILEKNKVKKNP